MKTFRKFLEQDAEINQIENNPIFKIKSNMSSEINDLLQWIQQNSSQNYEDIKNKMLNFRTNISYLSAEMFKSIPNFKIRAAYKEQYKILINKLNEFENLTGDLKKSLQQLTNILNSFLIFIQSKISV
ncbi:MAG TPA: hypothetical protein VMZ91_11140 [Candidatus Paceibacterota bacterium]|nr:hypothetical protein [Candidatus Paceibacterota bacterium]